MSYIEWLRARVGKHKIFLVFATVVLRDEQGRILLQRRTDFAFWGLPGGVMELNETVEMCARRELLEETGLTAGSLRLVGVYTDPKYEVTYPNGDQVQQFTVCFSGQVRGGVMQPDGQETTEQAFFAAEAMVTMNLPLWYADMVRDTLAEGLPTFAASRVTIDIADQIGTIRPFIGHDPLIAVGAAALVVRADGRLLAVQRQDNKMWALPAGYCDLGENVAHTAVRETLEETGLHIELERLLGVYSGSNFQHTHPNGDQVQDVGVVFRARVIGGQLHPQVQEVAALQWLTPTTFLAKMGVKRRPFFANILALDG